MHLYSMLIAALMCLLTLQAYAGPMVQPASKAKSFTATAPSQTVVRPLENSLVTLRRYNAVRIGRGAAVSVGNEDLGYYTYHIGPSQWRESRQLEYEHSNSSAFELLRW